METVDLAQRRTQKENEEAGPKSIELADQIKELMHGSDIIVCETAIRDVYVDILAELYRELGTAEKADQLLCISMGNILERGIDDIKHEYGVEYEDGVLVDEQEEE
ncbi:hypothetical protein [Pseudobacteriovorax antillogorgiicola]|uniref:Uncharacterized protein n=1 Tax=Pseudobacteriovorax antillogorgiicola TaxID=1513793 RepID=A0A1Y6CRH9_9BACT|nr:hypothetical protein [Pseudobacteriovorax antillogorgiicola]TCS42205.1 hypothetical protein EDD56_1432 [Pseudobacteriovorax antillogorgiicola]SMF82890.1 hypothetical protein SAMN06296036_14325 [Pseudobacteriovorax antillogorgiicola]